MKTVKKILKWLLLLSVPVSIYLVSYFKSNSIKDNLCISTARISNLHFGFKGNYSFTVEFKDVNGNLISNKTRLCFGRDTAIVGKYFLVAYNKKMPNEYEILIRESDYNEYGLQYPDSMKWVENYLNR